MTTLKRSIDPIKGSIDPADKSELDKATATMRIPTLFGTTLRAEILALTAGLERTYPRELARLVNRPISMVQRAIADLERAGVLVTRLFGNQREVSLNRDYIASKELAALLQALIERDPRYRAQLAAAARRRPRRSGKPL